MLDAAEEIAERGGVRQRVFASAAVAPIVHRGRRLKTALPDSRSDLLKAARVYEKPAFASGIRAQIMPMTGGLGRGKSIGDCSTCVGARIPTSWLARWWVASAAQAALPVSNRL